MTFAIDQSLHWTDHYVKHGFAVIKNIVSPEFCNRTIAAYQRALGTDLPPSRWTSETIKGDLSNGRVNMPQTPDLRSSAHALYDQPRVRESIATMLGAEDRWDGTRSAGTFVSLFDPKNERSLRPWGHVDFLRVPIPIFGSGLVLQVSLVKTEPFSGNITIYPGTHKIVQKYLMDHPEFRYADDGREFEEWKQFVPKVEPFEFVAEPGDGLFFHHLVGHNGNCNAAANRSPRVAIHASVQCKIWPSSIDPAQPNLSPWERSLALNGAFALPYDEKEYIIRQKAIERPTAAAAR